jgi:putative ABC transport system permease protein
MFRNYLKVAWRTLGKSKFFSIINICGLAAGMAVALLIGLWIYDELSFNKYSRNYERLGRVMQHQTFNGNTFTQMSLPFPLGDELKTTYKSDFKHITMAWWVLDHILTAGEKKMVQFGSFMEPIATEMFSLEMVRGSRKGLENMNSILLSASTAKALFGDADPIDQMMKIDNRIDVKVTGVYQDFPHNSEFKNVKFISSWDLWVKSNDWISSSKDQWGSNSFLIYVELEPNSSFDAVSAKIKDVEKDKLNQEKSKPQLFVHPMRKWHLFGDFENGKQAGGRIETVWLFGVIGLFVLLLACINFMNLSTARSEKRSREVGIRKTLGSARMQLINQFMSESFLLVLIAFGVALSTVVLALPWFNQLSDKQMRIPWTNSYFWLIILLFIIITSLLSGSYPALYLSSFNPLKVLKGTFRAGRSATIPRKALVVVQFTISVALIIGTIVVFRQVETVRDRPVGYSRDGLLLVQMNSPDYNGKFDVLRRELVSSGAVTEMANSSSPTFQVWSNNSGFNWTGKDPDLQDDFATIAVTHEYGKTVGWEFTAGRDFSRDFATDTSAIILNEKAVKFMNLSEPLGATVVWGNTPLHVVGVIKDMVMDSPFEPAKQTVFYLNYGNANSWINMRINPHLNSSQALNRIEGVFKKLMPAVPFDYKFADYEYAQKFAQEQRIGKLARLFAVLAIFISCLGVFGLAAFVAERKTKEIGIRKLLGASVFKMWKMLSRDFMILVGISCLISMPLAYYFLSTWLQQYSYRTTLDWWIFAVAIGSALVVTLLTVSFQAIKAAIANPVKSLRSE